MDAGTGEPSGGRGRMLSSVLVTVSYSSGSQSGVPRSAMRSVPGSGRTTASRMCPISASERMMTGVRYCSERLNASTVSV